jgi:hypothetical protein
MAKIPSEIGQLNTPRPNAAVAGYQVPNAEGVGQIIASAGRQVQAAGASFAHGAEALFAKVKVEQDRFDTLQAEDAYNKLRNQQNDLTLGEENGFKGKLGSQAMGPEFLTDYTKRFQDAAKGVEDTLTNDRQRERFRMRAGVATEQFNHELLTHIANQSGVYRKQVAEGTVDTEIRAASGRWDDPTAVLLSLLTIKNAVAERADAEGWAPEFRDAKTLEAQSKVHATVIGQAIASNRWQYAQEWFNNNREQIDPATAKVLERAVEDGTQKQLAAGYTTDFLAGRDSIPALAQLERKVTADPTLDETRRNALLGRIISRSETLGRQQEQNQRRVEAALGKSINTVNGNTRAGFEPSPEQLTDIVNAAKGTSLEGDAVQMVNLANATRQFRLSAPQAQEAAITRAETLIRQDPTKVDLQVLTAWKEIYSRQQAALREDPTTFAVRQGLIETSTLAAKPLDLTQPLQSADQLQARFALARSMASTYGAPVKPLTKEEADLLTAGLRSAPAAKKSEYFGMLAQASGGDMEGYRAMVAQISPDDPVTAVGGIYAGRGYRQKEGDIVVGRGQSVAELIFGGQQLLHPKAKDDGSPDKGRIWPMPSGADEQKMRQVFSGLERDAYAGLGNARNAYYQTSQAIYAKLSEQAGDSTGVLDSGRWEQSIKLATGGFHRYNAKSVVLPYGTSASTFEDGVAARIQLLFQSGQLPEGVNSEKLKALPLELAGDGKYVFRTGDKVVLDNEGRPIVLDFNRDLPFRTSGTAPAPRTDVEPTAAELAAAAAPVTGRAAPPRGKPAAQAAK